MKGTDEELRKMFEYAKLARLPLIVGAPTHDQLDAVEKLIKEYGIPVAIHNHGPEDKEFPSPREVMAAVKKRDKRLGVCMDVGHTVRAGVDPVKAVSECGDRLLDIHLKDITDKANKGSGIELGRGLIDVAGVIKTLHKRRFAGHVALEYEVNADNPMPGIRESLGFMRGVAAALT
jgi:sugar phosphate isomerase/epimerase